MKRHLVLACVALSGCQVGDWHMVQLSRTADGGIFAEARRNGHHDALTDTLVYDVRALTFSAAGTLESDDSKIPDALHKCDGVVGPCTGSTPTYAFEQHEPGFFWPLPDGDEVHYYFDSPRIERLHNGAVVWSNSEIKHPSVPTQVLFNDTVYVNDLAVYFDDPAAPFTLANLNVETGTYRWKVDLTKYNLKP